MSWSDILPRLLGVLISWGAGAIAKKTGVVVDPVSLTTAMLTVYAGTHKATTVVMAKATGTTPTPAIIPGKNAQVVTTPK